MSNFKLMINTMNKFVNDLMKMYPNDSDLIVTKNKFDLFAKESGQMLFMYYLQYVYPYKEYVDARDSEYFMSEDMKQSFQKSKYGRLYVKVIDLWNSEMSETNKQLVWKDIDLMNLACEKTYASLKS